MLKKSIPFVAGVLIAMLICSTAVTVLAATGAITIEIVPTQVMVNGRTFQPKDANGNDVMIFTYNGTIYAPLRALAESYGLEVGYDAKRNMATVNKPGMSSDPGGSNVQVSGYDSFEREWTVKEKPVSNYGNEKVFTVTYSGSLSMSEFKAWWRSFDKEAIMEYAERMAAEAQSLVPGYTVTAYFSYGQYNLGSVHAEAGYTGSNFSAADVWIK